MRRLVLVAGWPDPRDARHQLAIDLWHEAIAGSQYAEIESGHVVVFEQPAELTRLCQDFLFGDAAGASR